MTKARQRERKKRRQAEMQAGAGVSTVEDERATDEAMVRRQMLAEKTGPSAEP
jgi:hypothetical protein